MPRTLPRLTVAVSCVLLAACSEVGPETSPGGSTSSERRLLAGQALVISQIFAGGGPLNAFNADFVELHNTSASEVALSGYSLQYGSAAGTSWSTKVTLPNAQIPPGSFFLVRFGNPDAGTFYSPDFSTVAISMGGTGGKIALVNGTKAMDAGACPTGDVTDFIGYGSANCAEPSSASTAPSPSNFASLERTGNGCTDTDVNSADLVLKGRWNDGGMNGSIVPRNSSSVPVVCSTGGGGGFDAGAEVACGSQGYTCPSTSCCDDLGYISFCVDPNDYCFNLAICNPGTLVCDPVIEGDGGVMTDGGSEPIDAGSVEADAGVIEVPDAGQGGLDAGVAARVGSPCARDSDCVNGLGAEATCKLRTAPGNEVYVDGYCTVSCANDGVCPVGSKCISATRYSENDTICADSCSAADTCRTPGYACYGDDAEALGCWLSPLPALTGGGVTDAGQSGGGADAGSEMSDSDSGTHVTDAGAPPKSDAGTRDAGVVRRDAGTSTGGMTPQQPGCGCGSTDVGLLMPLAMLALFLRRRFGFR